MLQSFAALSQVVGQYKFPVAGHGGGKITSLGKHLFQNAGSHERVGAEEETPSKKIIKHRIDWVAQTGLNTQGNKWHLGRIKLKALSSKLNLPFPV